MNKLKEKVIMALVMVLAGSLLIIIFKDDSEYTNKPVSKDGFFFDTYVSISIYDSKENNPDGSLNVDDYNKILDECLKLCGTYQMIFSRTDENSELYKLNHSDAYHSGMPVTISEELLELIQLTDKYSKDFAEKFSIFTGDLCELWDYEKKNIPDEYQITAAVEKVSDITYEMRDNTIIMSDTNAPSITLGASAKGYIADRLTEYLKSQGIKEAIIDLGGNVVAIGDKYDDSMYSIGIKKPFSESGEVFSICKIADKSVVTSGIYERYFEQDGRIYHHIIDKTTGYPVENEILSVTIISDNSTLADCYSTGCLLFSTNYALDIVNQTENTECIIIDKDFNIILSDGLKFDGDYIVAK